MRLSRVFVSGEMVGRRDRWVATTDPDKPHVGPIIVMFCGEGCRHQQYDGMSRQIHVMCRDYHFPWCAHFLAESPHVRHEDRHIKHRRRGRGR